MASSQGILMLLSFACYLSSITNVQSKLRKESYLKLRTIDNDDNWGSSDEWSILNVRPSKKVLSKMGQFGGIVTEADRKLNRYSLPERKRAARSLREGQQIGAALRLVRRMLNARNRHSKVKRDTQKEENHAYNLGLLLLKRKSLRRTLKKLHDDYYERKAVDVASDRRDMTNENFPQTWASLFQRIVKDEHSCDEATGIVNELTDGNGAHDERTQRNQSKDPKGTEKFEDIDDDVADDSREEDEAWRPPKPGREIEEMSNKDALFLENLD